MISPEPAIRPVRAALVATITARVVDVLPNGNFIIESQERYYR